MPVVPESGLNARLSDIVNELQGLPHVLQSVREARDRIALLEGALREAQGALREITPAVEAYLMSGDVMTQGLKRQTWSPALKRARQAAQALAETEVGGE